MAPRGPIFELSLIKRIIHTIKVTDPLNKNFEDYADKKNLDPDPVDGGFRHRRTLPQLRPTQTAASHPDKI